jgi:hypothetical protein
MRNTCTKENPAKKETSYNKRWVGKTKENIGRWSER